MGHTSHNRETFRPANSPNLEGKRDGDQLRIRGNRDSEQPRQRLIRENEEYRHKRSDWEQGRNKGNRRYELGSPDIAVAERKKIDLAPRLLATEIKDENLKDYNNSRLFENLGSAIVEFIDEVDKIQENMIKKVQNEYLFIREKIEEKNESYKVSKLLFFYQDFNKKLDCGLFIKMMAVLNKII